MYFFGHPFRSDGDVYSLYIKHLLTHAQVRNDYQNLRRELVEVQAMQRELSTRLRAQLIQVHDKFARLRQKIAAASPR